MRGFLLVLMAALMATANADEGVSLFRPARVFDGEQMHAGWVDGRRIVYAGNESGADETNADRVFDLPDATLLPGLIEGHSHILLHPYDETSWNDQVLKESEAERVARAVNHVRDSLLAGVTTMRDLGSEGAGYADVGVRDSINKGIIHGYDDLVRVVRSQIGRNIDFVKVYADYRWGPGGTASATFTQRELETIVEVAESSGRYVVAHASTAEAMKRAILAGVETIEHGDGATAETYKLMREHNVALCPTLAAGDAITQYGGWKKGVDPDPPRITNKKNSFRQALEAGVTICFGGDVGVYPHDDNVRELEMMVEYGMDAEDAVRSATSVNADLFHIDDEVGRIRAGMLADIIVVPGDPTADISALRNPSWVLHDGKIVKQTLD